MNNYHNYKKATSGEKNIGKSFIPSNTRQSLFFKGEKGTEVYSPFFSNELFNKEYEEDGEKKDIEGTAKIKGQFKVFTPIIKKSVGEGGKNEYADVLVVQKLLQDSGFKTVKLNGKIDNATINAIRSFQKEKFPKWSAPDGLIEVNKSTWKALTKSYFQPDSIDRKRKQFSKKRSILISPLDITSAVKSTLAFVKDENKDSFDDALKMDQEAADSVSNVDHIRAKDIRHISSILQKYYEMGISMDTIYITSHGSYLRQAFVIGNELITYTTIPRLKILKNLLAPNTKLVVTACHVGGGKNPNKAKLFTKRLAQTLGITVYTSRSWGRASTSFSGYSSYFGDPDDYDADDIKKRPNVYKYLGQWLEAVPGPKEAKIRVINSLKIESDGTFSISKKRFPTFSSDELKVYNKIIDNMKD